MVGLLAAGRVWCNIRGCHQLSRCCNVFERLFEMPCRPARVVFLFPCAAVGRGAAHDVPSTGGGILIVYSQRLSGVRRVLNCGLIRRLLSHVAAVQAVCLSTRLFSLLCSCQNMSRVFCGLHTLPRRVPRTPDTTLPPGRAVSPRLHRLSFTIHSARD